MFGCTSSQKRPVMGEMFIDLERFQKPLGVRRGGTQLGRYTSSTFRPSERHKDIHCVRSINISLLQSKGVSCKQSAEV